MTTNTPVPAALTALIEPLVAESGLDIYDLERAGPIVRVIVDLPPQRRAEPTERDLPGGPDAGLPPSVGIGDIAKLTRAISRAIDEHDPLPGQFTLEVTSPGLERNLRTPSHFQRAVGEKVSVKTVSGYDGPRRLTGVLTAADDEGISLLTEATAEAEADEVRIDHRDIDKARTLYEWAAQAKPGSKQAKPGSKNNTAGSSSKKSTKKSSPKKAKAS